MPYGMGPNVTLRTGPEARELVKRWEGVKDGDPRTVNLDPYLCPANYWTIGWGHVVLDERGRMLKGRHNRDKAYAMFPGGITPGEADTLLRADLIRFERFVHPHTTGETTPGQFGAMVSLCFNIGPRNFNTSSVARFHKAGEHQKAADAFLLWNKHRQYGVLRVSRGLVNRRQDERRLYLRYTPENQS